MRGGMGRVVQRGGGNRDCTWGHSLASLPESGCSLRSLRCSRTPRRERVRKACRASRGAYRETIEDLGEAAVVEDGPVVIRRARYESDYIVISDTWPTRWPATTPAMMRRWAASTRNFNSPAVDKNSRDGRHGDQPLCLTCVWVGGSDTQSSPCRR
jgi:hypothetical protein